MNADEHKEEYGIQSSEFEVQKPRPSYSEPPPNVLLRATSWLSISRGLYLVTNPQTGRAEKRNG